MIIDFVAEKRGRVSRATGGAGGGGRHQSMEGKDNVVRIPSVCYNEGGVVILFGQADGREG